MAATAAPRPQWPYAIRPDGPLSTHDAYPRLHRRIAPAALRPRRLLAPDAAAVQSMDPRPRLPSTRRAAFLRRRNIASFGAWQFEILRRWFKFFRLERFA